MTYYKRILIIAIILFSCVGCDQVTKATAQKYLSTAQQMSYFGDMFRFQYMENNGAFLSLGAALPAGLRFWLLIVLTGIAVAGMLVFLLVKRNLRPSFVIAMSLIIAGGVGNFLDRTFNNGAVIDFMNIGVGSLRTGVFNMADVALMIGMGCLLLSAACPQDRKIPSNEVLKWDTARSCRAPQLCGRPILASGGD